MKKILKGLICFFVLLFLFSLSMILIENKERREDVKTFEEVLSIAVSPETDGEATNQIAEQKEEPFEVNLSLLRENNPDCVAWIRIEETQINYPVMYTPDRPQEYLRRNFYGKKSSSGVPFLDERCTLQSGNLIIHGHNMLNGTMFAGLKKYLDKSFYNEHKTIELHTEDGVIYYEVFAAVALLMDDVWYSFVEEMNESDFDYLVGMIEEKRLYKTDASASFGDGFITLSTCYGKEDEDRLILIGVKKRQG